jgi:hypothetical protein
MSKEETPPIIRWLHRYVYRGLGWVFLAGVLSSAISLVQRACQGRAH